MTSPFDFTNDEWSHLVAAPVLVGLAVARAEDSGFFGSMKEIRTLLGEIAAKADEGSAGGLVAQVAATESVAFDRFKDDTASNLAEAAVSACERARAVLDQRADPDEASAFSSWLLDVAATVADSATEGGVRVSAGESALIDRFRDALSA